jgi:hypothetical protein
MTKGRWFVNRLGEPTWLDEEAGWWCLSFTDPDKAEGEQFLGNAVVWGTDIADAMAEAWRQKLNPGGEVLGVLLPSDPPEEYKNRFLPREEVLAGDYIRADELD